MHDCKIVSINLSLNLGDSSIFNGIVSNFVQFWKCPGYIFSSFDQMSN